MLALAAPRALAAAGVVDAGELAVQLWCDDAPAETCEPPPRAPCAPDDRAAARREPRAFLAPELSASIDLRLDAPLIAEWGQTLAPTRWRDPLLETRA